MCAGACPVCLPCLSRPCCLSVHPCVRPSACLSVCRFECVVWDSRTLGHGSGGLEVVVWSWWSAGRCSAPQALTSEGIPGWHRSRRCRCVAAGVPLAGDCNLNCPLGPLAGTWLSCYVAARIMTSLKAPVIGAGGLEVVCVVWGLGGVWGWSGVVSGRGVVGAGACGGGAGSCAGASTGACACAYVRACCLLWLVGCVFRHAWNHESSLHRPAKKMHTPARSSTVVSLSFYQFRPIKAQKRWLSEKRRSCPRWRKCIDQKQSVSVHTKVAFVMTPTRLVLHAHCMSTCLVSLAAGHSGGRFPELVPRDNTCLVCSSILTKCQVITMLSFVMILRLQSSRPFQKRLLNSTTPVRSWQGRLLVLDAISFAGYGASSLVGNGQKHN